MTRLAVACALAMLPGCATMQQPNMTAEQLKAVVADKNFSAVCSNIVGPWGTGKVVFVNVDKSVVVNGAISVTPDCTVTMSNEATVKVSQPALLPVVKP